MWAPTLRIRDRQGRSNRAVGRPRRRQAGLLAEDGLRASRRECQRQAEDAIPLQRPRPPGASSERKANARCQSGGGHHLGVECVGVGYPAIGRTRPAGGLPRHRGIMGAGPRRSVRARRRCVRSARRFRSSLPPQRSAHRPVGRPETGVQMKRPWRCLCSGGASISVKRNHKHR